MSAVRLAQTAATAFQAKVALGRGWARIAIMTSALQGYEYEKKGFLLIKALDGYVPEAAINVLMAMVCMLVRCSSLKSRVA